MYINPHPPEMAMIGRGVVFRRAWKSGLANPVEGAVSYREG